MQETVLKVKANIKALRIARKLSRAEFSRLSGIPLRTLEDIESDKTKTDPKLSTLLKIVNALGITLNDLYL